MRICTVDEMREMDRRAMEEFGIPEEILMENAGIAACTVLSRYSGIRGKDIVILCGGGNNGGDGLVMARKIHSLGGRVCVWLLSDPEKYKGAAKINYDIVSRLPIAMRQADSAADLHSDLMHCDTVIDAIFGTGLSRNVEGKYKEIIEKTNYSAQKGKCVLSLDIPSGVHGNTGRIMGGAVKADYTVTFGGPKLGNVLWPGYVQGGRLFVSRISFPPSLYQSEELKTAVSLIPELPSRNAGGHKGSFGDALFIGGAAAYYGAPRFAAQAFLKTGGGYSRLAAPESLIPVIAAKCAEIVYMPQAQTASGSISPANREALLAVSRKTDMTVLGPGLSLNEESQELARQLTAGIESPLLIDGDAITALCKAPRIIADRKAPTVLTPHMGEMSRISGRSMHELEADPMGILRQNAVRLNAFIVLKGSRSGIACPDGRIFINMSGNSGMATAGSGDVLCGVIAAMYGLDPDMGKAVKRGVFIHGLAGDMVAENQGEDGMTAEDILNGLPLAMKTYRQDSAGKYREIYEIPTVI